MKSVHIPENIRMIYDSQIQKFAEEKMDSEFWTALDNIVIQSEIVIDRPMKKEY